MRTTSYEKNHVLNVFMINIEQSRQPIFNCTFALNMCVHCTNINVQTSRTPPSKTIYGGKFYLYYSKNLEFIHNPFLYCQILQVYHPENTILF